MISLEQERTNVSIDHFLFRPLGVEETGQIHEVNISLCEQLRQFGFRNRCVSDLREGSIALVTEKVVESLLLIGHVRVTQAGFASKRGFL